MLILYIALHSEVIVTKGVLLGSYPAPRPKIGRLWGKWSRKWSLAWGIDIAESLGIKN